MPNETYSGELRTNDRDVIKKLDEIIELLKQLIEISTPEELPEITQEPRETVIRFQGDGL